MEARANFGSGGGDTFAALHADVQAQNSYISAARQAMTWVPVLNLSSPSSSTRCSRWSSRSSCSRRRARLCSRAI
jgi:hypothetical protein